MGSILGRGDRLLRINIRFRWVQFVLSACKPVKLGIFMTVLGLVGDDAGCEGVATLVTA